MSAFQNLTVLLDCFNRSTLHLALKHWRHRSPNIFQGSTTEWLGPYRFVGLNGHRQRPKDEGRLFWMAPTVQAQWCRLQTLCMCIVQAHPIQQITRYIYIYVIIESNPFDCDRRPVMLFWNRVYQNPLNFRTNGTIKSNGCYVSTGTDNDDIMVLTVLVIASTVVSLIIRTRSPDMTIHMYGSEIGYPFLSLACPCQTWSVQTGK